jgi:hypothetical protein
MAYTGKQMYPEAFAEYRAGLALDGKDEWSLARLGQVYAATHDRGNAGKIIVQLERNSRERLDLAMEIAMIYSALQEKTEAVEWLGKAYENREGGLILIQSVPYFQSIRSDPRFAELARKIGLPGMRVRC